MTQTINKYTSILSIDKEQVGEVYTALNEDESYGKPYDFYYGGSGRLDKSNKDRTFGHSASHKQKETLLKNKKKKSEIQLSVNNT